MKKIQIDKRFYNFPESWNELSGKQLINVLSILRERWSPERKVLAFVKTLAGLGRFAFIRVKTEELAEYFYLTEFLLKDNTLTKQLLPKVYGLVAAADGLGNLNVKEYIFSEAHYIQYKEGTKSMSDLNNLIAILYRPAKVNYDHVQDPDGDRREPFNANLIGLRGSQINKWPIDLKLAIFHWYEGCRLALDQMYSEIFTESGEPAKRGMLSVALAVADEGVFGTMQEVEQLNIHLFLIGISESLEKSRHLQNPPNATS